MSRNSDYKNLKELTKSLVNGVDKLESGNLNSKELTSLLEDSRTLHERITVLQYLAFDKEVKGKEPKKIKKEPKKAQGSFELNFGTPELIEEDVPSEYEELDEDIHPNQTNLLDAIEEHIIEPTIENIEEKKEISKEESTIENTVKSINEKFAGDLPEKTLAEKLSRQPISDLKEAIGINQKFLFMNDLFEGENEVFHEVVNKINACSDLHQAMAFIDGDLSIKYDWDKESQTVLKFIDLVERRFMA